MTHEVSAIHLDENKALTKKVLNDAISTFRQDEKAYVDDLEIICNYAERLMNSSNIYHALTVKDMKWSIPVIQK